MKRMCQRRSVQLFILIISLFTSIHTSFANDPEDKNGIIKGKVFTSDGKPAADVAVVLIGTDHTTTTDGSGTFSFRGVKPGNYRISISLAGYSNVVQEVTVASGEITAVSLQLDISRKELHEVVITGNQNKLVKRSSEYVAKLPLMNLENPQVYTTITKELMAEQLIFTVDDALRNAPGLTKMWDATGRSGDGGSFYNSRGFIVQSYLRDGIAGNVSAKIDAANLERIEVIKGPSATLFGNVLTSYGGLINRVTKKPYDSFGGEVSYAGGSYEFNRFSADINTPLDSAKNVLLRINTSYNYEGSFQDYGFNKTLAFAPSLSYKVNDKLSFQFDGEFYQGQTTGLRMIFIPYGLNVNLYGVNRADELGVDYKRAFVGNDLHQTSRNVNFFGQMNYKISDHWTSQTNVTVTNSFSNGPSPYFYLLPDTAVTGNPTDIGHNYMTRGDQFTDNSKDHVIEIQQNFIGDFNIGSLRNRFVGGLDFFYHNSNQVFLGGIFDTIPTHGQIPNYRDFNRTNLDKFYQANGTGFPYYLIFKTNTYSAYVSDVLNITDNLMLLAALRVDHFNNKGNFDPATGLTTGGFDQTALSPKLGIVFQPIKDRISIFGNYQNGFTNKQGTDYLNNTFKPEQANQLEGGIKLDAFGGRLSSTLSYYNIKVKDIVRAYTGPDADPNNINPQIQDGTQLSSGFEAEVIASPFRGMNVVAGFSYNDSKLEKTDEELEGRRPGTASSPIAANLWLSYHFSSGALKGLGFGFGGNYASDNKIINTKVITNEEGAYVKGQGVFILPAYTILNASAFYDTKKLRFGVKMDNITNQEYWIGYTTINSQKLRSFTGSIAFKF